MYILDTNAFLWFICGSKELSNDIKESIEKSDVVYVSVASFWEMAIKESIGKLKLPKDVEDIMSETPQHGIKVLPIEPSHLARLRELPFIHRDPFDRLIVAQARAENLTLITSDSEIAKYDVSVKWE